MNYQINVAWCSMLSTLSPLKIAYIYLAIAIICEVAGTTFLAKSAEFTRWLPTTLMVILYGLSFYMLAKSIKVIPLGIAYALWGGVGIILTACIGVVVFKQTIDLPATIGISLIVAGVVVLNVFSKSVGH